MPEPAPAPPPPPSAPPSRPPSSDRPLLIWDGDCSFCRRWIQRWQHLTGNAIEYEPSQRAAERVPQVPREEFGKAVHLVEPDGRITRAAHAVYRSLALAGQKRYLLWLYRRVPPFAWASETGYAFIARHRNPVDRLDRIVVGTETRPARHLLTRALFLRLLGVIYLIAFTSLYVQIDGLIGSNGILPVAQYVAAAEEQLGASRWWLLPTLVYLNPSDAFLNALCLTGIVCSTLLIVGALPLLMTMVLWATYLSLAVAGQVFFSFQWDVLLLETGLLAILWSPPLWLDAKKYPPSRVVLFLLRWLLFRLMFLSALVKWISGDESWRRLEALRYHFETQPLPTWTSWSSHHSPHWMLLFSCFAMFVIEGIIPFLYFAPRRTRLFAFWMTVLLQVTIIATGNYGFFNFLTLVLCVTLLDDAAVSRLLRRPFPQAPPARPVLRPWIVTPIAAVLFLVTGMAFIETWRRSTIVWPQPQAAIQRFVEPFRSTNSYGLFRVMTRDRPEIIIEGSDDARDWKPYAFKWKPGDVDRPPPFCVPHMPRLDWQMWFAALRDDPPTWFVNFAVRLLQGKEEVIELLASNPFPDRPPRYLRAVLYDYRFSDRQTRRTTGEWWVRRPVRLYLPPISIEPADPAPDFRL